VGQPLPPKWVVDFYTPGEMGE